MVHCKHCATANCLDALFCKKCGTALSQEDVKEAQARLDTLLVEGRKAFEEGRTEEALAVTERVLDSNPSMTNALALRMEVHARRGEISQALDCAERLVELNPDSEIDKIRRDGLRSQLAESLRPAPAPDRRFALVAGFSAVVLVACIGVLAARLPGGKETPSTLVAQNDAPTNSLGQIDPGATTSTPNPQASTGNKPDTSNLGPDDVGPVRDGETQVISSNDPLPIGNNGRGEPLPRVNGTHALGGDLDVVPVVPTFEGPIGNGRPNRVNNPGGALPNPAGGGSNQTTPPTTPKTDPDPVAEPPKDTGEYTFNIHRATPSTGGGAPTGSVDVSNGNGVEALLRTATQYYQLGNYSGAAGAWEKALAAGADALSTNQRLAMAYDNLGRKSEAAGAYRRAIAAGESMLAAGKGNPDRVRSAIETCKAALGGS